MHGDRGGDAGFAVEVAGGGEVVEGRFEGEFVVCSGVRLVLGWFGEGRGENWGKAYAS